MHKICIIWNNGLNILWRGGKYFSSRINWLCLTSMHHIECSTVIVAGGMSKTVSRPCVWQGSVLVEIFEGTQWGWEGEKYRSVPSQYIGSSRKFIQLHCVAWMKGCMKKNQSIIHTLCGYRYTRPKCTVCVHGHAPTCMSKMVQRLLPNWMNGTACSRMHRMPLHPHACKQPLHKHAMWYAHVSGV